MPGRSQIVDHPEREAIEDALDEGLTNAEISKRFGLSNQVVGRYRNSQVWRSRQRARIPGVCASDGDEVQAVRDEARVRCYALLRLQGFSQRNAAKGAGIGYRTGQRWEAQSWYSGIKEGLRKDYFTALEELARGTFFQAIFKGDGNLALKAMERLSPEMDPTPKEPSADEILAKLEGALGSVRRRDDLTLAERIRNQDPETYARLVEEGLIEETTDDDSME